MAVQLIPACLLLGGGFMLHESPLWLMRKGREEEAAKVLESLRNLPQTHTCELTLLSNPARRPRSCGADSAVLHQTSKRISK